MAIPRRMRASRGTIALVATCIALLVAVPIVWLLLPDGRPQSADEARAELTQHLDNVVATLPDELVTSDELTSTEKLCPTDEGVRIVELERVVILDPSFERMAWPQQLRSAFKPEDNWHVRTSILGREGAIRITLVGADLSVVTATSIETEDDSRLTLRSSSPCTAE